MQLMSARAAQKTKNESRKLSMYSKQWLPGDTLRVFYPIFWADGRPELAVGAVWGHQVSDIKGLGLKTSFIPSTTGFDKDGQPIGQPDITYQFSLIARVFVDGQKAIEEAAIQKKNFPMEQLRKDALKEIEYKYDTKNNLQAVQPIIRRATYAISTEVVSVKIANGSPDPQTVAHTSCPLSNDLIDKLYALMDNERFRPNPEDKFFEVEWCYVVDPNKSVSGRKSAPAGLTAEYRMATQFPEAYKVVQGLMGGVSQDSETIVRRATRSVDPNKVRAAVTQYAFMHSEALDAATDEDVEILVRNAALMKDLTVMQALTNKEIVQKIDEALAEAEKMAIPASQPELPNVDTTALGQTAAPAEPAPAPAPAPAPEGTAGMTVDDDVLQQMAAAGAAAGAPSLQDLMNSQYNVGQQEDVLMGMDNDYV